MALTLVYGHSETGIARRVFESTLRRGSWIERFRSFFIFAHKSLAGAQTKQTKGFGAEPQLFSLRAQ